MLHVVLILLYGVVFALALLVARRNRERPITLALTGVPALAAFDASQLPSRADVERIHRYQSLLERSLYRAIERLAAVQVRRKSKVEGRKDSVGEQEAAAEEGSLALRGADDAAGVVDRDGE